MRPEEYRNQFELEDSHWRYIGLKEIVNNVMDNFCTPNSPLNILDAGCGTGMILSQLKKYSRPLGIDISAYALYFCKKRGLNRLSQASVTAMPFKENYFDAILNLDVICHQYVNDDYGALTEIYRILKKNGKLIINVPAYNFLHSGHDEVVFTRHRYTKNELRIKLEGVGFIVERITYWNAFFFPLVAFFRIITKILKPNNHKSDLRALPQPINRLLTKIIIFEAKLLRKINFPYGLSIICVAKK
jgi:SAM-dependent methyltransferase